MPTLNPVDFLTPIVNPSPAGLWVNVAWQNDNISPARFLSGVQFRAQNFDGAASSGVWGADWCADFNELTPDDIKTGDRGPNPLTFDAVTMWSYAQCDLTRETQAETTTRAQQTLRLNEQQLFEREFAGRLNADVVAAGGVALTTSDFVDVVGELEDRIAQSGQLGVIHAQAKYAARAAANQLLVKTGTGFQTPTGNKWVFGGGYSSVLNGTLIATAPLYGWRDEAETRDTIKPEWNQHIVIAERSAVVGYEHLFAAVKYNHTPPA